MTNGQPELDWLRLRAAIHHPEAELALYVHLTGEASAMKLFYAGFEPNQVNQALSRWRASYVLIGQQLTRDCLLNRWPGLAPFLTQIEAGEFNQTSPVVNLGPTAPVLNSEPVPPTLSVPQPASTNEQKAEVQPVSAENQCTRTAGCVRKHNHSGHCTTLTPAERQARDRQNKNEWYAQKKSKREKSGPEPAASTRLTKAASAPATAVVMPEPTVASFRFKLEIEEVMSDGERSLYQTSGDSRAKFQRVITAANTLLNLEG